MDKEEQVIFGASTGDDGVAHIVLGIPAAAFERMRDGKTSTFDLTKAGLAVKIVMYGAPDHATAMKFMQDSIAASNSAYLDLRREDFGIKDKQP